MAIRWKPRASTRLIRAALLLLLCLIGAVVWWGTRRAAPLTPVADIAHTQPPPAPPNISPGVAPNTSPGVGPGIASAPDPSPAYSPDASTASPSSALSSPNETMPPVASGAASLLIPVAGVRADQLRDTYTDSRSEGRVHDAIDIPAARNTPVLAAADGRVVKLFQSERGGTTLYQLDPDDRTVYYYAHLDHYADNLTEGHFARRGEVIAYVGDTGNAVPGNYHLHFSISIVADPKRYFDGVNINPYPLLHGGALPGSAK